MCSDGLLRPKLPNDFFIMANTYVRFHLTLQQMTSVTVLLTAHYTHNSCDAEHTIEATPTIQVLTAARALSFPARLVMAMPMQTGVGIGGADSKNTLSGTGNTKTEDSGSRCFRATRFADHILLTEGLWRYLVAVPIKLLILQVVGRAKLRHCERLTNGLLTVQEDVVELVDGSADSPQRHGVKSD